MRYLLWWIGTYVTCLVAGGDISRVSRLAVKHDDLESSKENPNLGGTVTKLAFKGEGVESTKSSPQSERTVANEEVFEVAKISFQGDVSLTSFKSILQTEGIVALGDIPGLREARNAALVASAKCVLENGMSAAASVFELTDQSREAVWGAFVYPNSEHQAMPSTVACPDLSQQMEELRRIVEFASDYFFRVLDEAMPFQKTTSPTRYDSFTSLIRNATHLDHFRAYEVGRSGETEPAIKLHTDHGLLIAIVPALHVTESGFVATNENSFKIKQRNESITGVKLPDNGNCIVFMFGDGINYLRQQFDYPPRSVPHLLSLSRSEFRSVRSWFGRMFFAPNDVHLSESGETFHSMIDTAVRSHRAEQIPSMGCSQRERRILQDPTNSSCAAGSIYCWMACVSTSNLECQDEAVCQNTVTGLPWIACDDCNDPDAKPVCPPKNESEMWFDPIKLFYSSNSTHGRFRLQVAQQGYVGFGVGLSMLSSVVLIGMDGSSNPSHSPFALYKIQDYDGALQELATSPAQLSQFGISATSFVQQSSLTELRFTVEVSQQNEQFTLITNAGTVNVVYAFGPLVYAEHYTFGRRQKVQFLANSTATSTGVDSIGFYDPFLSAHIILMILAWQLLIPIGVMFPLLHNIRPGRSPLCGRPDPQWFKHHWIVQTVAVVLGYIGVLLAYLYINSKKSHHWDTPHKVVGLTVLLGSIVQPVFAHFRPHLPKSGFSLKRRTFEVGHQVLGYSLVLLGMTNSVLGLQELQRMNIGSVVYIFGQETTPTTIGFNGALSIFVLICATTFSFVLLVGKLRVLCSRTGG